MILEKFRRKTIPGQRYDQKCTMCTNNHLIGFWQIFSSFKIYFKLKLTLEQPFWVWGSKVTPASQNNAQKYTSDFYLIFGPYSEHFCLKSNKTGFNWSENANWTHINRSEGQVLLIWARKWSKGHKNTFCVLLIIFCLPRGVLVRNLSQYLLKKPSVPYLCMSNWPLATYSPLINCWT